MGQESHFLDFLKVILDFFKNSLGIILRLKRPTFGCICWSKGWEMTQKFEILGQNFDHFGGLRGNCWPLWGCEKSFFTFFLNCSGVVLGMFRYYFRTWKAYFWVYLQLLRLIPELYTLLWGPADALLNFDYAFAGLFIPVWKRL